MRPQSASSVLSSSEPLLVAVPVPHSMCATSLVPRPIPRGATQVELAVEAYGRSLDSKVKGSSRLSFERLTPLK